MAIQSTVLTTSSATIFNPNDAYQYAVTTMFFCNTTDSDVVLESVNLVVGQSGSPSSTNQVISNLTIPARDTFTFETEKIILSPGDKVYARASAGTSISATVCTLQVG
jgi:hypothetical protein